MEKSLGKLEALFFHYTLMDDGFMVRSWQLMQRSCTSHSSHFGIFKGIKNFPDSSNDGSTCTHWARLFSNIKLTFIESPITDFLGCHSNGKHFSMSGGILTFSGLIMRRADHISSCIHNHCPNRNFVIFPGSD